MKITLLISAYKANSKSLPGHIRLLKRVIILVFRTKAKEISQKFPWLLKPTLAFKAMMKWRFFYRLN